MPKHYTIKPQITPLPGKTGKGPSAGAGRQSAKEGAAPGSTSEQPANDPFIRAENERWSPLIRGLGLRLD